MKIKPLFHILALLLMVSVTYAQFPFPIPTRPTSFPLQRPSNVGVVTAWGTNNNGELSPPSGLRDVVQIEAGGNGFGYGHTLALKADGTVMAWGANTGYSLGATNVPTGLNNVVQVAAGGYHSLALKSDGTVVSWGSNDAGQCSIPSGLTGVVQIAAGDVHSVALKSDGTVVAWGSNSQGGQLNIPSGLNGVVQIATTGFHTLALKSNGTVVAWGANTSGQSTVPSGLSSVVQVAAGRAHSLALKSDGTVVAWGDNTSGQRSVPTGLSRVVQIAASSTSVALEADGTISSWGNDSYGQSTVPTGLTSVIQVSTGEVHTVALKGGLVSVLGGTLPNSSQLAGHTVSNFLIGKYEVTWGEWKSVRAWAVANGYTDLAGLGDTYPSGMADNFPVISVSWYDVVKWMNAKSQKDGLTPVYQVSGAIYKTGDSVPIVNNSANGYRLPSEKEWEWAARGGVSSQGYTYSGSNDVNAVAWYYDNSSDRTKLVGTKAANELGIHDMSGNAWEWCWDVYDQIASGRRIRGGSGRLNADSCPVAARAYSLDPDYRNDNVGFRIARNAVSLVSVPEVSLEQPAGTALQNSQTISFGNVPVGGSQSLTFTIKNTGTALLTGLYINNYGWDIQASPVPSDSLAPGGSMTFTATYTPYWGGQSSSTLEIYSNDPTTNPFTINLTGNGLAWWMDSDGDGMNDSLEYSMSYLGFDWQVSQPALVSAYNVKIEVASPSTINLSGKPLTQDLVALGGTGFLWQVSSGTLPPGVSLNSSGQISGTPTTPGSYKFTVKVTNAEGFPAYRSMRIRVIPPSTFGGGYNFANFAGSPLGFSGSSDASFLGSGAASGGFTGSADGRTGFTGSADSASRKPFLYAPAGVAVDASGNIYVSDTANNQIRKISATGAISNVAGAFTGSGGVDGTAWNARFNNPQGMTTDASGNVYVADQDNHAIRRITPNRAVSTLAGSFTGSGAAGFSGSADGGAKSTARFNRPADVAVDAAGNIYVADSGNHAIRKISTDGTVTTLAGTMGAAGNTNATGSSARFRSPQGIAVDGNGTVYVADTGNQVIRRITPNGTVSTFAGAAFTGSASPLGGRASFTGSAHAAFIGSADATTLPASVDGSATTARFSYPTDITIDSAGNLYVTDSGTEKMRRISANGSVTTLGGSPDGFFYNPLAVAAGANGTLYVADAGNNRIARGIPGASAIAPPVIIAEPSDFIDVFGNTSANFSVTATGGNLTYQWYRNGIPVSGANAPTLLRTASPITEGLYTVAVSNVLATEFSEPAILSLRPPAEWTWGQTGTEQPVRPGDSVTFSVDNVTGPGGAISYQWLRNGKPLPGKTSPILMLNSVSLADGGNYALVITTAAGKVTTESQKLVVDDQGALVYKLRGTSSTAHASGKESSKLDGYLVRDRTNNYSYLFWLWPTSKGGGGNKIYSFESRSDITEKSTGPFSGSTSVLRAFAGAGIETITSNTTIYPDGSVVTEQTSTPALPGPNEEMVWISGTDSLITLSPSLKTLATATMTGQINATYDEDGMVIDMTNITLNLDRPQTLKARTIDENDISNTLNRLMLEIESKGYQMSN